MTWCSEKEFQGFVCGTWSESTPYILLHATSTLPLDEADMHAPTLHNDAILREVTTVLSYKSLAEQASSERLKIVHICCLTK